MGLAAALSLAFAGCATERANDEGAVDRIMSEYLAEVQADRARDYKPVESPPQPRGTVPAVSRSTVPPGAPTPRTAPRESAPLATGTDPAGAVLPPPEPEPSNVIKPSQFLKQGTLTIQPETVVRITVKEDATLGGQYRVDESGAIQFKYVGLMFLDNLTVQQAGERIRERLEGSYMRSATVKVEILQASFDTIRIIGLVNKGGDQRIGAGSSISLSQALLRAEGVKALTRNMKARIVRGGMLSPLPMGETSEVYPLVDDAGAASIPDLELRNKDLVYVFEAGGVTPGSPTATPGGQRRILLLGEVNSQGYISFGADEPCSMLHLSLKVGGFPRWAQTRKVEVVRKNSSGEKEIYQVNAEKVLESGEEEDDFSLEDGDIVRVPARTFGI